MKNKNPLKALNPFKFFSVVGERENRFKKGKTDEIPEIYPVNKLNQRLHPLRQFVKIVDVRDNGGDCKTFVLAPNVEKGTKELAYFSAGKYVSVFLEIEGVKVNRAYSLCSAPKDSLGGEKGIYEITVKGVQGGLVSRFILDTWQIGTEAVVSGPEGNFEYIGLRDAKNVICVAGGSGITPFLSMAKALAHGDEDFNMLLLYGSRNEESILFKAQFDELQKTCKKIRVVHVLSEEEKTGYEHGFISADLILKYAKELCGADAFETQEAKNGISPYSVFLCGPQAMYNFVDKELEKLGLEKKYIRHEMFGEVHGKSGFDDAPKNSLGEMPAEVHIKVKVLDEIKEATGSSDDTILQILEKNGIEVPSRCRSGECGWCHSYIKSGKVYIPAKLDFRRKADEKFGWIHPCCSFALSDLEMEIAPSK
ncbi:MAG: iron-sulfur cluster-binding domain-containing protein [Treponema sp.]|nr:iron-sulfur cluster-binding domain-containing protein [Treponema sp.]